MAKREQLLAMLDEDHEIAIRCRDRAIEDGDYNVAGNFQHRAAYINDLINRLSEPTFQYCDVCTNIKGNK